MLPGADVRIEPGLIAKVDSGEVLSLADQGRHVLLELPHEVYLPLEGLLSKLEDSGLHGILSHPERNAGIMARPNVVKTLVSRGCLIQATAAALTGGFGPDVRQVAEWLVKQGLVHFVSSDAHSPRSRRRELSAAFDRVAEMAGHGMAVELFCTNPAAVVSGREIVAGARAGRNHAVAAGCRGEGPDERAMPTTLEMTECDADIRTGAAGPRRLRIGVPWAVGVCGVLMFAPSPADAAAAWVDQQSVGPFVCRSDFPLAEIQPLLAELGQLQSDLVAALEVPPAETAIEVYIFRGKGSYDQFLTRYLPKVTYRRALYVKEGCRPGVCLPQLATGHRSAARMHPCPSACRAPDGPLVAGRRTGGLF